MFFYKTGIIFAADKLSTVATISFGRKSPFQRQNHLYTRCHILLDSLQKLSLMHGIEVDYKDDDKDNHSLTEKWKSLIPMLTALCMWREEPRDKTYS